LFMLFLNRLYDNLKKVDARTDHDQSH